MEVSHKTELPYDPAVPPLGCYSDKQRFAKDICTPIFNAVLSIIGKIWNKLNVYQ